MSFLKCVIEKTEIIFGKHCSNDSWGHTNDKKAAIHNGAL